MKITGFTFIRNAIKFDYPIVESIKSILPICDNFVVAVGNSDDNTRDLVSSISPKIKIIDTIWNDSLREGGKVLADETNKAFQAISSDTDWAFYIQGDEVVHEKYLDIIQSEAQKWNNAKQVDGLLFKYLHFYGSYNYVGISSRWYKNEIRLIKNNKNIYSYRDAQGFRKDNDLKLNVKPIDAYIYHYGWVKNPVKMQTKQNSFHKMWHSDEWVEQNIKKQDEFNYNQIDALSKFTGLHPEVMIERIKNQDWNFDYDISFNNFKFKDKLKIFANKILGLEIGIYKNYKIV